MSGACILRVPSSMFLRSRGRSLSLQEEWGFFMSSSLKQNEASNLWQSAEGWTWDSWRMRQLRARSNVEICSARLHWNRWDSKLLRHKRALKELGRECHQPLALAVEAWRGIWEWMALEQQEAQVEQQRQRQEYALFVGQDYILLRADKSSY